MHLFSSGQSEGDTYSSKGESRGHKQTNTGDINVTLSMREHRKYVES